MPGATQTYFSSDRQPVNRRTKSPQTLIQEAILAETGKDMPAFWQVVVKKAMGEEGSPYMKMLMDRLVPVLKSHMMTVHIEFPISGTSIEQAQAVLTAVAQGTLPLDYAGPMLAMIQLIDTAKGGSLGNSGLDLSALYQGTDGLKAATDFAKQIAALQPKPTVIDDITPKPQEPIVDAVAAAAHQVLADLAPDHANGTSLIEDAATRLAARYPASTHTKLYNAICDAINALQQEDSQ